MVGQVLPFVLGMVTVVSLAGSAWLLVERARLRQRFAGILDLEREITLRRHAFNIELSRRQSVFNSEIAAQRRALESELAKHAAAIDGARGASAATN